MSPDLQLIIAFSLGFACGLLGMWKRGATPQVIVQREIQMADGEKKTVTEPVYMSPGAGKERPDNEKARRFATTAYSREMEEALTRGEGYPK